MPEKLPTGRPRAAGLASLSVLKAAVRRLPASPYPITLQLPSVPILGAGNPNGGGNEPETQ